MHARTSKLIGSPFISLVDSILSATIAVDIALCFPNTRTDKVQTFSLEDQIVIYSKHFRTPDLGAILFVNFCTNLFPGHKAILVSTSCDGLT